MSYIDKVALLLRAKCLGIIIGLTKDGCYRFLKSLLGQCDWWLWQRGDRIYQSHLQPGFSGDRQNGERGKWVVVSMANEDGWLNSTSPNILPNCRTTTCWTSLYYTNTFDGISGNLLRIHGMQLDKFRPNRIGERRLLSDNF